MDNYEILLNEIKKYLNKQEINNELSNVEVISLYDFCNIINSEFKKVKKNNKGLYIKKFLENPKIKEFSYLNNVFYITINYEEKMKELEFTCSSLETDFKFQKDIKSDEMSYSCEHTKKRSNNFFLQQREISKEFILKFLKNYYKKIKKIAYFIEELSGLTGDFYSKDIISKTISNNLFSVVITLDYSKMLNCENMIITNLTISTSNPLFNEYKKNWYGRENIYDIVEKNKEEILKRIPISIYSLPAELKNIYYTSLERKNNKEKTLTKSKILK